MKSPDRLVITNIGLCLTMDRDREGAWGAIPNAAIVVRKGEIESVGPMSGLKDFKGDVEAVDAEGALVTPGLIDCHTHLLFAGSRADEFFARLGGTSYEDIAHAGGGIRRTVSTTRAADDRTLSGLLEKRLDRFLHFGVTTVEIKSGYGLSTEEEIRHLRLVQKVRHGVDVVPTFLGAHVIPDEFKEDRKGYVDEVCEKMLPKIAKEKLAEICDVFCDEGAFTIDEARTILSRAKKLGLKTKIHADQLHSTGGAELAAEIGAISADHLEQVSHAGVDALAEKGVVAVLLPGAVFSLGKKTYPPARRLIDAGVDVAISTDCNPGTSYSENLPLMMSLAALELKMMPEEIWIAVTRNAAHALGLQDRGEIAPHKRADLVIWDASDARDVIYHYASSLPRQVLSVA